MGDIAEFRIQGASVAARVFAVLFVPVLPSKNWISIARQ